jgi:hypothetical protein
MLTPVTGGAYYQHFIDRGWSKLIQAWYGAAGQATSAARGAGSADKLN